MSEVLYLPQGVDYLGFLDAKLRDLRGWSTLANELIQNADDAAGATRITLDVTESGLIVSNDAEFTDCDAVDQPQCAWDIAGDGKKCCDFHAFRRVASGHKRVEDDTTGAFGIGFISVYQITDRPSLRSGRWQWELNPEADEHRRIGAVKIEPPFGGTRFNFPWAREQTPLRSRLHIEPVPEDVVARMSQELRIALVRAAPFLKRLQRLELLQRGSSILVVDSDREESSGLIVVGADGDARAWKRVSGGFERKAAELRARFGKQIEDKRKASVTVGISLEDVPDPGLLYASLPTEHHIELPVLINADFFPSSNRKSILFQDDYQGAWNRAAIEGAAQALAAALPDLLETLKPSSFWNLISKARAMFASAEAGSVDASFGAFWRLAKPALQAGTYVLTSAGKLTSAQGGRHNLASKEAGDCLPLFEALDIGIVHADLRPHRNVLLELGVRDLDLGTLTLALKSAGLIEPRALNEVPEWLSHAGHRQTIAGVIDDLSTRALRDKEKAHGAIEALLGCSLWLTVGGELAPASSLWRADASTRSLFAALDSDDMWAAAENPSELLKYVDAFGVAAAEQTLSCAGGELILARWSGRRQWLHELIAWIDDRHVEVAHDAQLRAALRALPIWPSAGSLRPLSGLSVPGNFDDPLHLAQVLDADVSKRFRTLLVDHLGAKSLDLHTYLAEHVPAAFSGAPELTTDIRLALLELLSRQFGQVRDDDVVQRKLCGLAVVQCDDGAFREPGRVYLRSPELTAIFGKDGAQYARLALVGSSGVADVLRWLGVREIPDPRDIVARIDVLIEDELGGSKEAMRALFEGLTSFWPKLYDRRAELSELKTKAWLPSSKGPGWVVPAQVYTVFRRFIFHSQAAFLDVPDKVQQLAQQRPASDVESLIAFLGIKGEPACTLVVNHLLHEASAGAKVNPEVFVYLDQHHDDPSISRLRNQKCLPIEGVGYVMPAQVFRGPHAFGRFRYQLSAEWSRFARLLDALSVTEAATIADALTVLGEMAQLQSHVHQLTEEDVAVNLHCWSLLSSLAQADPARLKRELVAMPVVPNNNRFLRRPSGVYFEDRPGLAAKFDEAVQGSTIRRPEGAWTAMAAAGVCDLSKVVRMLVVECDEPHPSERWNQLLTDRWPLVRRVMTGLQQPASNCPATPPDVFEAERLLISFALDDRKTDAENVAAVLDAEASRLFLVPGRKGVEAAVARELAFMLQPDAGAGLVAAALKEVLISESLPDAAAALSDLGIAEADLGDRTGVKGGSEAGLDVADGAAFGTDNTEVAASPPTNDSVGVDGALPKRDPVVGDPKDATAGDERLLSPNGGSQGEGGGDGRLKTIGRRSGTPGRNEKLILRSYLQPAKVSSDAASEGVGNERQLEVDRRGTELVLAHERSARRNPRKMDHFHEGYDIESDGSKGSVERFIEVKSLSGPWDKFSVGMSSAQYEMARSKRDLFWLYVVDNVDGDAPSIHMICDPASQVVDYRFDDGWRQAAESGQAPAKRSLLTAVAPKRVDEPVSNAVDEQERS